MKDLLPRPRELALFAALAVVSTAVVALIGKYDLGMAVIGRRRSSSWRPSWASAAAVSVRRPRRPTR